MKKIFLEKYFSASKVANIINVGFNNLMERYSQDWERL